MKHLLQHAHDIGGSVGMMPLGQLWSEEEKEKLAKYVGTRVGRDGVYPVIDTMTRQWGLD